MSQHFVSWGLVRLSSHDPDLKMHYIIKLANTQDNGQQRSAKFSKCQEQEKAQFHVYLQWVDLILNSWVRKAVNKEKALAGAFSGHCAVETSRRFVQALHSTRRRRGSRSCLAVMDKFRCSSVHHVHHFQAPSSRLQTWSQPTRNSLFINQIVKSASIIFNKPGDTGCRTNQAIALLFTMWSGSKCHSWGWLPGHPSSYSRPSLMIIASRTQFQAERPWGQRPFSIVS